MPYSMPDNIPDYIKNLPVGAQRIFVSVYNSTLEDTGDEDKARIAAWGAVKNRYEQGADGEWKVKATEGAMINLEELDTLGKLYASHNRLHAEYVDARHGARRKGAMQEDHTAVVGKIKEIGGRHIPHGEALDDTLPDELKEAIKLRYMSDNLLLEEIEGVQVSKIQVLRTGTFYHPAYGKFTITQGDLDNMVQNFTAARPKAPTEMVVDWEHMSVAEPPVIAKAAGWVRTVFSEDGKLFATVEWTADAVEQIQNKQYRFISPEIDLNYHDKESNEKVGPTLLSIALTNRPFIEGMDPVILSEIVSHAFMILAEESLYEQEDAIRSAYYSQFGTPEAYGPYVRDIYDEYIITEEGGKLYRLPYTRDETDIVFDTASKVEVQRITTYLELTETDLPDSSFVYIAPGGEKDEDGKTEPRSLRYLPFKNKDDAVDPLLLRDALAQLDQTNLSPAAKAEARKVLVAAAQEAGVGEYAENLSKGVSSMKEEELRTLFGLSEDDDVTALVTLFKAKADEDASKLSELQAEVVTATEKAATAQTALDKADAEKAVSIALAERKITPKMRDWALAEALRDRDAFTAFVAVTEVVGPELDIKGKDTKEDTTKLSEMEVRVAKVLGVREEDLIAAKEAAQAQA